MSKVSRSVYQKVVEENKKLKEDIEILVSPIKDGIDFEVFKLVKSKWQKHFAQEKFFHDLLREHAKKYIRDHKDELPEFLTRNIES